jgi:hypothetical protein
VPQIPLDAIAPVAPQVTYQDGQLTIVAPNSTLGDILRGVRKHTSADIEIPPTANERVVTRLGPGPAREVMAELLNGSRFNYILLGSPENANQLVRVVLVAKSSDTPSTDAGDKASTPGVAKVGGDAPEDPADDAADDNPEPAAEAEQPPVPAEQPGPKTPQQMLQEMQQRQLQMQQNPGQPGIYPPGRPGAPVPPAQPAPQPDSQQ